MQTLSNLYLFNSFQQSYEQVIDIAFFNLRMTPIICTIYENLQVNFEKFFTIFFSFFTCLFQKVCYTREKANLSTHHNITYFSFFSSRFCHFFCCRKKIAHTRVNIYYPGLKIYKTRGILSGKKNSFTKIHRRKCNE